MSMTRKLADDLRSALAAVTDPHELTAVQRANTVSNIQNWVCRLHNTTSPFNARALRGVLGAERAKHLINSLLLADSFANAGDLKVLLKRMVRLLFADDMSQQLVAFIESRHLRIFDKSEISRSRQTVDVAFMLYMRERNTAELADSDAGDCGCVRYLMVDSSPQYGRDYQIVLCKSIKKSSLKDLWHNTELCFAMWRPDGHDDRALDQCLHDEDLRAAEAQLMEEMAPLIRWHVTPAVQIGFGASNVQRKVHAILHSLRLELSSHAQLLKFWKEIVCITSDYGTEFKICYCRPVPDLFPWWQDAAGMEEDLLVDDDLLQEPHRDTLAFQHLLPNDGLLHCIDNCTKDLAICMPGYRLAVRKLKSVAKLVKSRGSRDKLIQRCFSSRVGGLFADDIRKYKAGVYLARWGTVAFAVPEMLKLRSALTHFWDLRRYRQGSDL